MDQTVIWHGTLEEGALLTAAIERNCTCGTRVLSGDRCGSCAFLTNQRSLDRLLFARWMADDLRRREFRVEAATLV